MSLSNLHSALEGTWTFDRNASSGESMAGSARFVARGETRLHYREQGILTLVDGTELKFERSYIYEFSDAAMSIYFDTPSPRLFQSVVLTPHGKVWAGSGSHLCGADRYASRFEFAPAWQDRFRIVHKVTGPRKDYVLETRYHRCSL